MRPIHVAFAFLAFAAACGGIAATGEDYEAEGGLPDATAETNGGDAEPGDPDAADASRKPDALPDGEAGADASDAGADADADAAVDAEVEAAAPDPVLVKFAVVGDYGNGSGRELLVSQLIATWTPELIVTVGDNDYANPHAYDDDVGQFYHSFIYPYAGAYGAGAAENAFFPAIGNHDWDVDNGQAYFDFFELPGNERYFELDKGPIHFVFLDSDTREPDGTTPASVQGAWAQAAIAASASPFQFVVFHHPAYTSGGRTPGMDWPFKTWGANAVLTGHVHNYERLRSPGGLQYFVVGQGGVSTAGFSPIHPSSQVRYNTLDGAQLVEVGLTHARFRYYDVAGTLQDDITIDPAGNRIP